MNSRIVSLSTYMAVMVVMIDQLTKRWAMAKLPDPSIVLRLTSFLSAHLAINHGLDFFLFGQDFSWLVSLAFIVIGTVTFFVLNGWRLHMTSATCGIGAGLIMGGILGNLFDRLRFGPVIDFLDFHIGGYHSPLVNFAECAMLAGIFLLLMDILAREKTPAPAKAGWKKTTEAPQAPADKP